MRKIVKIHFDTIDSTQTYAKKNFSAFDVFEKMICITSDMQTEGKGQWDRTWASFPKGNLYTTLIFRMAQKKSPVGSLSLLLAFSVVKALERLGIFCHIKWPNDIFLNQKKVGGILGEVIYEPEDVIFLLGLGLNIFVEKQNFLDKKIFTATSLNLETGKKFDPKKILDLILEEWKKNLDIFEKENFHVFLPCLEKKLLFFQEKIRFFSKKEFTAVFHSLSNDGSINLLINGSLKNFHSGSIVIKNTHTSS